MRTWPSRPSRRGWLTLALPSLVGGVLLVLGLRYPRLLTVMMVLAAGLAVLAVGHVLFSVLRVQYASRWGVTRSVPAKVTRKWAQETGLDFSLEDEPGTDVASWWVTFAVENGRVKLRVPESLFAEVEEGMVGILTYQGGRLLSFLPSEDSDQRGREEDDASRWGDSDRPGV